MDNINKMLVPLAFTDYSPGVFDCAVQIGLKKEAPDLVVMGTRGRSNLSNSIIGAVAEKVFKNSPVNMLSYRDEDVKKRLEKKLHLLTV